MSDITMCTNLLCPLANDCKRSTKITEEWQSWAAFEYWITINGCICDYQIEKFIIDKKMK